jgi:hypothetical protein
MYRGKNNGGKLKDKVCKIIAKYINSYSMQEPWNGKQVFNKILHLEQMLRKAFKFANKETGIGLLENDIGSFKGAVTIKVSVVLMSRQLWVTAPAQGKNQCHMIN